MSVCGAINFALPGQKITEVSSHKMDTDEVQFLSFPRELKMSDSSDQLVPEDDTKSSVMTSPLYSPSYRLDLLRLSSESDECFEMLSPFSPCAMEFAITDETQCKGEVQIDEHQTKVSFDSGNEMNDQVMIEMESMNDEVTVAKSGQEDEEGRRPRSNSLKPHLEDKPTGQPVAEERHSDKDTRASRRNSSPKAKEQKDPERATTHQNTAPSHLQIPSSSHLALRRRLKRQACQDPSRAKPNEQNVHASRHVSLKSPRKSPAPTTRKIKQSTRGSKTPRNAPIEGGHFVYPEIPQVPRPPTKKSCMRSGINGEGHRQETPSLKSGQTETSSPEKHGETFQERNRKATIPFLPKICPPNRLSCPMSQKSPRKSPRKSPKKSAVFATRKISQLKHSSKSPRSAMVKHSYFLYPETLQVLPPPKTRVRLGSSGAFKARRMSSVPKGDKPGNSKSKDGQTETRTSPEKRGEPSPQINSSVPSLPKIRQPRQRRQSRDQEGSSLHTTVESCAVAPQGPQSPQCSPRSRAAKQGSSSSLQMSDGNPNAIPSVFVVPPAGHLAQRRKLTRGTSSPLQAESRDKSTDPAQAPRLLSRPSVSPNRLGCPVSKKSPRKSPGSRTRKIKQSTRASKTPKSALVKDRQFVFPEIPPRVPRTPTRETRVGPRAAWEGHKQGKSLLKNDQAVTSTPEKHVETSEQRNSSVPSLPKIPNVQPTKEKFGEQRVKSLLDICNSLSSKRTVQF